jgi:hypothetical protein
VKVSRLKQLLNGRSSRLENRTLISRDGLLDSLLALFEECRSPALRRNTCVKAFLDKRKNIIYHDISITVELEIFGRMLFSLYSCL